MPFGLVRKIAYSFMIQAGSDLPKLDYAPDRMSPTLRLEDVPTLTGFFLCHVEADQRRPTSLRSTCQTAFRTRQVLLPPNPKEFDTATRTLCGFASRGT